MISIIVTAFKEPESIKKTIRSIIADLPKNYEILVVCPDNETWLSAKNEAKNKRRVDTSKSKATADANLTDKKDKRSKRTEGVAKAIRTKTKYDKKVTYTR